MRRRAEVYDLAVDHCLSSWADQLANAARVGWVLRGVEHPQRRLYSRIGGLPDFAKHESWPVDAAGRPMTHLAQIVFDEMPALSPEWRASSTTAVGHDSRLLRIFADLHDNPIGLNRAAALCCEASRLPSTTGQSHSTLHASMDGNDDASVPPLIEHAVQVTPTVTVPELWPGIRDSIWDQTPGPAGDFQRWYDVLMPDVGPEHVLGGHPRSLQDDVRTLAALNASKFFNDADDLTLPDAWTALLRLDDDEGLDLTIGDGGSLNVLIPIDDLSSCRLDRLLCVPESS